MWFKYPNSSEYVLQGINFKINATDKTSIVGLNGCGKTTIVNLLLRFYEPNQGEIIVNGINIKEYEVNSYRKNFGVLFQDYPVYYITVRKNITISDLSNENDDTRIGQAVELSGLDKLQNQFPKGLATEVSKVFHQDGIELSGGNIQKLALARAFFRAADIMILDEPSASLDAQAEYDLFSHFNALHRGKGAILISHRLSNVCDSNMILFIEGGKVSERGTHKELLGQKGRYAKLFNLQASKYHII